jgi:integrase
MTKRANALVLGDGKWTPHDLRRTAATLMQELGVLPVVIEKCLNHREENKIEGLTQISFERSDF